MKKHRSFLKWAGGKYKVLSRILKALPQGSRLVEPFTGSGVVALNTDFPQYLLGEYNEDLVHLYRAIQQQGSNFISCCAQYFTSEYNTAEKYYQLRETFNTTKDALERASLLLYLNRHGYNGLCRYNSRGKYNVPFGLNNKPYFPQQELLLFYEKCQKATIVQADFRETFKLAKPGDVFYCDPPYVPLSKTADFTSYTTNHFNMEDQMALANLAETAAKNGIHVILSNHDTELTRELYQAAKSYTTFPVRRNISCNPEARQHVDEVIAIFSPT